MNIRRVRPWTLALAVCGCVLGGAAIGHAEINAQEFDQWYYSAPETPNAHRATEALKYYVHLTGTAANRFASEKEYRLFIAARARFFG